MENYEHLKKISDLRTSSAAKLFKTLCHPLRLQIVNLLAQKTLNVSEISKVLSESQPNVSHQLSFLKNQKFVSVKKVQTRNYYNLENSFDKKKLDYMVEIATKIYVKKYED